MDINKIGEFMWKVGVAFGISMLPWGVYSWETGDEEAAYFEIGRAHV